MKDISPEESVEDVVQEIVDLEKHTTPPKKKAKAKEVITPTPTAEDTVDYSKLTVVQLKDVLRSKGMKVSGRKAELIERLRD